MRLIEHFFHMFGWLRLHRSSTLSLTRPLHKRLCNPRHLQQVHPPDQSKSCTDPFSRTLGQILQSSHFQMPPCEERWEGQEHPLREFPSLSQWPYCQLLSPEMRLSNLFNPPEMAQSSTVIFLIRPLWQRDAFAKLPNCKCKEVESWPASEPAKQWAGWTRSIQKAPETVVNGVNTVNISNCFVNVFVQNVRKVWLELLW